MKLWPFGRKDPRFASPWDGPWWVGELEEDDLPFVARVNTGARALRGRAPFEYVVEITVPFRAPTGVRMPSPEEHRQLQTLEQVLMDAMEVQDKTLLTVVLTGDGERRFVLYTADPDSVKTAFDTVQPRLSHGLRMEIRRDANWDLYRELDA